MGFSSEFIVQFACVFAMFLIWFFSLVPIRRAQASQEEGYDNSNPRDQYNKLSEWGKRAVAAANNTFEGLVFFSVAVFTQAFSRMFHILQEITSTERDRKIRTAADVFCIIYIVLRVIYLPLYWYNIPSIRSSVWGVGILCILALFVIAFI
ncbi:membrane-associated, eicosanoid/glutathione metabolism protein [Glomus cerebriforme]|uniref:Membrane-associated, eicosanoid/glutathione metabolism protein n=1 Tax=Glomus cerebriforme TaxID=658196 RepID=A0A397TGX2_9GLOM|nr:membrane-associated, eicosanoid/glutathione metabolism protein [Glomus cerebriforme]